MAFYRKIHDEHYNMATNRTTYASKYVQRYRKVSETLGRENLVKMPKNAAKTHIMSEIVFYKTLKIKVVKYKTEDL